MDQAVATRFIFISYARRDARETALRLQQSLIESGYRVWLDTSEIDGGASWSNEIEDAIERCDITLALLSHGSYLSEICRAEQLRALRKGKRVIPILVQPNAERPLHLEHLNYRDFTDPTTFQDNFRTLINDLGSDENIPLPEIRRQTIVSAPPLPPHFIPRTAELAQLRTTVIGDATDREIALTALRGMGGIGKSVLATCLCHDEVIQAAFPDGIIWVTIGREPGNLTEHLKFIGMKLGDSPGYYTSEAAGVDRLRVLMANKAVLLVLDDVWNSQHVLPFRIEAPRSRTLFTTRDSGIALTLSASEVRLGMLNPSQAHSLLKEWAGRDDESMAEIAEKLGYLPLALKLAGARLREGMSGKDWLTTFRHVSQIKLGRRSTDPHENLEVCFDLSVQQLVSEDQLLYHAVGVFPEDIAIPENAIVKLWRQMEPALSDYEARELVIDLSRLALIDRNSENATITLHDLLHDYTRSKLGDHLQETHIQLLKAYNPKEAAWPTIPHDGYLYHQLGYHLIGAGRLSDFVNLLIASPDWLEAKFIACEGDIAYVADLDLAMRQYTDPLSPGAALIMTQLYTARQIINMRASIYTDDDLETLVWLGRKAEAVNHARLRIDPRQKFIGLQGVYRATAEMGTPDLQIRDEMVSALRNIPDDAWRRQLTRSVVALLRHHRDPLHTSLFREGIDEDLSINRAAALDRVYHYIAQLHSQGTLDDAEMEQCCVLIGFQCGVYTAPANLIDHLNTVEAIARKLLDRGQLDAALKIASGIPSDTMITNLVDVLYQRGDYARALTAADALQKIDDVDFLEPVPLSFVDETLREDYTPEDARRGLRVRTFGKLAVKFARAGHGGEAWSAIEKGQLTEIADAVYGIMRAFIEVGNVEQALAVLKAVSQTPWPHTVYQSLWKIISEVPDVPDGDLPGESVTPLERIIQQLTHDGYLDETIEIMQMMGEVDFDQVWILKETLLKGVASSGRVEQALNLIANLDELRTQLLPVKQLVAEARLVSRSASQKAWALVQRALKRQPDDRGALEVGILVAPTPDERTQYLDTFAASHPESLFEVALALYRAGMSETARRTIARIPSTPQSAIVIHLWQDLIENLDDASYREKILSLDVSAPRKHTHGPALAALIAEYGESVVKAHLDDQPNQPYSERPLVVQGINARRSQQAMEAQGWLLRALDFNPHDDAAWRWLAVSLADASQRHICLQNVLKLEPDSRWALAALQQMSGKNVGSINRAFHLTFPQPPLNWLTSPLPNPPAPLSVSSSSSDEFDFGDDFSFDDDDFFSGNKRRPKTRKPKPLPEEDQLRVVLAETLLAEGKHEQVIQVIAAIDAENRDQAILQILESDRPDSRFKPELIAQITSHDERISQYQQEIKKHHASGQPIDEALLTPYIRLAVEHESLSDAVELLIEVGMLPRALECIRDHVADVSPRVSLISKVLFMTPPQDWPQVQPFIDALLPVMKQPEYIDDAQEFFTILALTGQVTAAFELLDVHLDVHLARASDFTERDKPIARLYVMIEAIPRIIEKGQPVQVLLDACAQDASKLEGTDYMFTGSAALGKLMAQVNDPRAEALLEMALSPLLNPQPDVDLSAYLPESVEILQKALEAGYPPAIKALEYWTKTYVDIENRSESISEYALRRLARFDAAQMLRPQALIDALALIQQIEHEALRDWLLEQLNEAVLKLSNEKQEGA